MKFEFASAGRILFGSGAIRDLGIIARDMGDKALVVTGRNAERAKAAIEPLEEQGLQWACFPGKGEPDIGLVRQGVDQARAQCCDFVISFGGGSAIDSGKAIAAMMTNEGKIEDYLEVIGGGKALASAPAPCIAIPTTAGTGSEVTRNAVIGAPEHRVKVSLRSPLMPPRVAIVDPDLTLGLPPAITASTGLDALTQLIEPYVSSRANPITDGLCRQGIPKAARSLSRAVNNPRDIAARTEMSLASLLGGLALANAGLGVVHGFAAPLGGMFAAPHGAICAAMLPHGMRVNIRALRRDKHDGEALRRYADVARLLTGKEGAAPEDGADWVEQLCRDVGIPSLRAYGVAREDIPALVEKASRASSMKANPVALTPEELAQVLALAL